MQKSLLAGLIIMLSVICCCGTLANDNLLDNSLDDQTIKFDEVVITETEEDIIPTLGFTPSQNDIPTIVVATEELVEEDQDIETEPSHIPGLDPSETIAFFKEKYKLDCVGWSKYWDIWSDDCFSSGFNGPLYSFSIFSRKKDSVDFIEAGIIQEGTPRIDVIYNYFTDVLNLPYIGSSPEIIMDWIKTEMNTLIGTPHDIREFTHNDITYKLHGDLAYIWLEIGEIEQYIEIP